MSTLEYVILSATSLIYGFGVGAYTVFLGEQTAAALEDGAAGYKLPRWWCDLLVTFVIMIWPMAMLAQYLRERER